MTSSIPVEVVYGSSLDPARPPSHSVSQKSFWATTGTFPQVLVVRLLKPSLVPRLKLSAVSVDKIRIEGSLSETADSFIPLGETEKFPDPWKSTVLSLRLSSGPLHYLRFVLESGVGGGGGGGNGGGGGPAPTTILTQSPFSAVRGIQLLANSQCCVRPSSGP